MRSARVIPILGLTSCAILATACGVAPEQDVGSSPNTAQVGEAVRGDTPEIEVGYSRDFASQGLAIELEARGGISPPDQPLLCYDIKNPNLEKKLVRFEVDLYEDVIKADDAIMTETTQAIDGDALSSSGCMFPTTADGAPYIGAVVEAFSFKVRSIKVEDVQ